MKIKNCKAMQRGRAAQVRKARSGWLDLPLSTHTNNIMQYLDEKRVMLKMYVGRPGREYQILDYHDRSPAGGEKELCNVGKTDVS